MTESEQTPDVRDLDPEQTEDSSTEDSSTEDSSTEDSSTEDTFSREYVEALRGEAKGYRLKVREAEESAAAARRELFAARVRLDGRLADPDLAAYSPELDDADALSAEIGRMIAANPRMSARYGVSDTGAGRSSSTPTDLIAAIRGTG